MSIRVSEKHGVNPTMGVCFWCGQEDGTIGLVGRLPDDVEAPRHMVLGYEPCDKCKAGMALGVTLIECVEQDAPRWDKKAKAREIQDGLVPTGRWMVVRDQWVVRNISPPELMRATLEKRKAFVQKEIMDALVRGAEELEKETGSHG